MVFSDLHICSRSLLFIVSTFVLCCRSDVPRPRGVSLTKASLYSPTKDFSCFDGTVTIPFSYVNDDYCDCFDGSDEPGTSACMNGVFHCTNAGHRSQNIPSSRVNDGLCDCCDGTDEYSQSGINCGNTCDDLGREARAEAQRMAELLKAGSQLRQELIEKGNLKRSEMAQQLSQLEKDKSDAEVIRIEKESLKTEIEAKESEALKVYREADEIERAKKTAEEEASNREEAENIFTKFDSDADGLLTIAEIQTRSTFDKNKDGEVSEEEAKYFLAEHSEVDRDTFNTESWPLIKPFLMIEQGLFRPKVETNVDESEDLQEEGQQGELEEEPQEEDVEELDEGGEEPSENTEQVEESQHRYDEHTQQLVDAATEARQQFTQAERTVREIDSNMRNIKQALEKDYGLQQEFATLDGQCHEFEDKEYVYKLCLFDRVTQKSKAGGSDIGLGSWGEWVGEESDHYRTMKYTNGVSCWNGPNRSTTVNLHCGLETKVLSVNEPFRCEYNMEVSTPAACDDSRASHLTSHDEL